MNYLRDFRMKTGLSVKEFSKIININVSTYRNYELHRRIPSFSDIDKIVLHLNKLLKKNIVIEEIFPSYIRKSPYPKNIVKNERNFEARKKVI